MRDAPQAPAAANRDHDIGTLWIVHLDDCTAKCALCARADGWELHVSVDGDPLLSQRCETQHDVFALADRWRRRMVERGWKPGVA